MADYNFWRDLLDTYQSTADWVMLLWIVMFPAFILAVLALVLKWRLACTRPRIKSFPLFRAHDDRVERFRRVLGSR